MNAFELAEAWPRSIKNGRRAAARGNSGYKSLGRKVLDGKVLGEKVLGEQPWGGSLDEKHSDRHERSDSVADFAARDWHHHDPVCRTAGGGCGDSGAGLEPLIFRLPWLAKADLSAGDLRALERIGAVGVTLHHH